MLTQRAVERSKAQLKVILWDSGDEAGEKEALLAELPDTIALDAIQSFTDVLTLLKKDNAVGLVVTVLRPSDLQMLYQIQQLQKEHPHVSIVALVGEMANFKAIASTIKHNLAAAKSSLDSAKDPVTRKINEAPAGASSVDHETECRLTPRQRDVLALLMQGQSNKQIARMLDLSEGTVKIHCMAIFRELGVANRTQAALKAEQILPELCYS